MTKFKYWVWKCTILPAGYGKIILTGFELSFKN